MAATKHVLVLGGVRSGKSALAEQVVSQGSGAIVYLATAMAGDEEMAGRIRDHQARRPGSWDLLETPLRLGEALADLAQQATPPDVLVDCMSLWVSNLLHVGAGTLDRERERFLGALETYPGKVVIVSNEVGLGIIGMDPLTRRFADQLGWLNQALAARCERVVMSVAGLSLELK